MNRRHFLASLATLNLASCSNSSTIQSMTESFKLATSGFEDVPVTRAQVSELPYASIGAKIGKGPKSFLVLGKIDRQQLHWFSADRVVLVTEHGRLSKVAGLERNLSRTLWTNPDPLTLPVDTNPLPKSIRLVDIMPGDFFQIPIEATYTIKGSETITILGLEYKTRLIEETCSAPLLDWQFTNRFWQDVDTGFIWRSEQFLTPDLPQFMIEVYKPVKL